MVYSLSFLGVELVGKLMLEIHSFWDTVQISCVNVVLLSDGAVVANGDVLVVD